MRQLRDKLHLIRPHWPSYSNGVGVILGDVNICDPEPDIHRWWPEKDCHVPLIFHMFLTLPSLITRGGTPQPLESYAPCRELIVFFSFYLWLKHVMFTVPLVFSRTWEIEPFRVITQQYASSFKSQQIEDTRLNVFPAGCPNISFSVPFVQRLHDDHRFSTDPFGALAEFKVLLEKAKRLTIRELSRKTLHSIGTELLIASTALRAYRNRHLGTLMRCCEAWKPTEDCFDPIFF